MMSLGDEMAAMDATLSEKLLPHRAPSRFAGEEEQIEEETSDEDEYELISQRETLVFEDALRNRPHAKSPEQSLFQMYLVNKIQPGSIKGSMFTMTVAIVGAGVLALPYAIKQAGFLFGLLLIIAGAVTTNFSLRLLLTCAELAHARSYMDLAHITGGSKLAGFTQFIVCLNLFGTCVGYLVGGSELIQLASEHFVSADSSSIFVKREALILILCFVFVLPLSLFRSLESLRFTSLFSILCIVYMTLTIVIKYFEFVHWGYAPTIDYQLHHLVLFNWHLPGLLKAIPLVIFAYTCHPNVLPIYLVLKRKSSRRMYKVMNRSIGLSASVYVLCGAFVVLTFGEATKSNFLKNDYHGDGATIVGCIGFSIALILTVPLFVHTLRDNIKEAIWGRRRLNSPQHILFTLVLVAAVLTVALAAGDIASVLGVLGATTNPVICFLLPAFFILKLGPSDVVGKKVVASIIAIVGAVVSVLSLLQQLHLLTIG